ncbi:hypothetical protein [Marinactinospora rubrisoli]|uniref:DoxX family membrane protein n=1 Tax=Marinactinospora rubrisoli TaxID=2715399 RepID=A0ABW2KJS0_9ACTN
MLIPLVLLTSLLAFRALGALGVHRFRTWQASAAHGLAVMLLFTAGAHFVPPSVTVMPNSADMIAMVPPQVPAPEFAVYATGVLELAGAAGLVLPATRRAAGWCLAAFFVLIFPANVHAALNAVPLAGEAATPLVVRVPEQVLYIGVALWAALPSRAARAAERDATAVRS